MDDDGRRRRQEHPGSSAPSHRYSIQDASASRRSFGTAGSMNRYRPASINTTPAAGRTMSSAGPYGGYYQEPAAAFSQSMTQNTMPYPAEYAQDSRHAQGYSAYNTPMLYNVPQQSAQSAVYDTNQQYSARQPAGLQLVSSDVGTSYYQGEPASAAAVTGMQPQAAPSSSSAVYQQTPADQRMLQQSYPSGVAPAGALAQAGPEQAVEEEDYRDAEASSAQLSEAYQQYLGALRGVFTDIVASRLQIASESLLNLSEWLLSKVVDLGLTVDNESLHQDRLKLWKDFNHAWLALFQKQKDMTEPGIVPQRDQSVLSEEQVKHMGNEIVRLCENLERYGLVDYECGVWEERIVDIIIQCHDVYKGGHNEPGPSASHASGSTSRLREA
ncbi:hypothetical protein F4802DRAFT_452700 [Xylaria palmicola]|nr:hypothetical protein F4802DRAFT_452700 [Xylaria palmicola]